MQFSSIIDDLAERGWSLQSSFLPSDVTHKLADECRKRGIPFVADPSQQLAFSDGEFIRDLIEGAEYLITNEYESHLTEQKTGWSQQEIDSRVTYRVTTLGKDGVRITGEGIDEPIIEPNARQLSDSISAPVAANAPPAAP